MFVWNTFLHDDGGDEYADDEYRSKSPASESSLVGYEIAPGIGSVMPTNNEEAAESFKEMNIDIHNVETTTKKVSDRCARFPSSSCSRSTLTHQHFYSFICAGLQVSYVLVLGVDGVPFPCARRQPHERQTFRLLSMPVPVQVEVGRDEAYQVEKRTRSDSRGR